MDQPEMLLNGGCRVGKTILTPQGHPMTVDQMRNLKMGEKPRIGECVYFYRFGLTDNPTMAFVVSAFSEDLVDLSMWDVNRWVHTVAINRHDCPAAKNNPTLTTQRGTWDYRDPPEIRNAIRDLVSTPPKGKPSKE